MVADVMKINNNNNLFNWPRLVKLDENHMRVDLDEHYRDNTRRNDIWKVQENQYCYFPSAHTSKDKISNNMQNNQPMIVF